ncbi:hypothetical protein SAMN05421643_104196 [Acinetobacter kyonggiensis]|uniref:Uncharacterized protein n=1 Tax=Acinetobacter kyonggiensis TaxID=595670 RepID=A0A1H3HN53_9GAMM|nr:hypothetical protein SAMN05421643_104196 [Acinetobacter kyonggiensis]
MAQEKELPIHFVIKIPSPERALSIALKFSASEG